MAFVRDADAELHTPHTEAMSGEEAKQELLHDISVEIARSAEHEPSPEQEELRLKARQNFPKHNPDKLARFKASLRDPKMKQELVRLLAKTFIFAETIEAFREAIIDKLVPVEYAPGQVVYRQGTVGSWMGILIMGRIERKLERETADVTLGEVGPGGTIGDLGLFGISPFRSFTVTAHTPCEFLVLDKEAFEDAVQVSGGLPSLSEFRDAQKMQNLMSDAESFLQLQCFKKLDRDFVLKLRENSEPRLCYQNQVLMKEGHHGDEMYILRAGTVKIEKEGKFVVELGSGVVLGELAVLGSDKRRTATVTCNSLCLIRTLHADVFHEILGKFPAAKRVFDHAYVARLVSLEVHNSKDELAYYDTFFGSAMPRTQAQLSKLVGLSDRKHEDHKARTGTKKVGTVALPALTAKGPPSPGKGLAAGAGGASPR